MDIIKVKQSKVTVIMKRFDVRQTADMLYFPKKSLNKFIVNYKTMKIEIRPIFS